MSMERVPHNKIDLNTIIGEIYGRLKIIEARRNHYIKVDAICECGNVVKDRLYPSLKQGKIKSCGCLKRDYLKINKWTINPSKVSI